MDFMKSRLLAERIPEEPIPEDGCHEIPVPSKSQFRQKPERLMPWSEERRQTGVMTSRSAPRRRCAIPQSVLLNRTALNLDSPSVLYIVPSAVQAGFPRRLENYQKVMTRIIWDHIGVPPESFQNIKTKKY